MLIFLLLGVLCMLGWTEGQNCTFPRNWINKDFTMTDRDEAKGFWNFSETTFVEASGTVNSIFMCVRIVGRFLIVRRIGTPWFVCFPVKITNADSFTVIYPKSSLDDYMDVCDVCSRSSTIVLKLSAVDTVARNQTKPECNIPVGCPLDPRRLDLIGCVDTGNIEGDFDEATTPPPTTPPPTLPTTPPPYPPPKRCKHRHQ